MTANPLDYAALQKLLEASNSTDPEIKKQLHICILTLKQIQWNKDNPPALKYAIEFANEALTELEQMLSAKREA